MGAQHAALFQHQANQLGGHPFGLLLLQRSATNKATAARLPGNRPSHVGRQRGDAFVHVLAVEVHARFQTQGVARAQADGRNTRAHQFIKKGHYFAGRQHDFQTVFAGIPGAGDKPVAVGLAFKRLEALDQAGAGRTHQFGSLVTCLRPLNRQHGQFGAFLQVHVEINALQEHPGQVLVAGGGIHHHTVTKVGEVDDQVIHHAALLVEHAAVQRLTDVLQALDVIGQQVLQIALGLMAADIHNGHVRHIKHPALAAHLMVFLDLRTIVQRHVPTAEVDHFCPQSEVQVIKRCALSH